MPIHRTTSSRLSIIARRYGLTVLTLALALFAGARADAIRGGRADDSHRYDAVVKLSNGCSGTLITDDTVLTAAHCVCSPCAAPYGGVSCSSSRSVIFYDVPRADSGVRDDVTIGGSVVAHPDYCMTRWSQQDYALIKLATPASQLVQVEPIPIEDSWRTNYTGTYSTLVGWGLTDDGTSTMNCNGTFEGRQYGDALYTEYVSYADPTEGATLVFDDTNVGACPGDSGGPALNGRGHVHGVASWGDNATNSNYKPTLVVKDWIKETAGIVGRYDEPISPYFFTPTDRIDWCLEWASDCGAPAAHAFCDAVEGAGSVAGRFAKEDGVQPTFVLGSWDTCTGSGCDSFDYVQCTDTTQTTADPMFQGERLDFCRFDGGQYPDSCGQPAADAWCRTTHGSDWYSNGWVKEDDIGRTRIIATSAICDAAYCDGFAEISCAWSPPSVSVANDADSDGVTDASDNCPDVPNPIQENSDADLLGDACDANPTVADACADDLDNDGDGLVDLLDPGCVDSNDTSELEPNHICDDGWDSDSDGLVDMADPGCSSPSDSSEKGIGVCDDGIDNDQDGRTDYPFDADCSGPFDADERSPGACGDGIDNDGNGRADWSPDPALSDPGCTGPDDPFEFEIRPGDVFAALQATDQIARIDPVTGAQSIVIDSGVIDAPMGVAFESSRRLIVTALEFDRVWRVDLETGVVSLLSDGAIDRPYGVAVEPGGSIFVGQWLSGGEIYRLDPVTGEASVFKYNVGSVGGLAVANGQLYAAVHGTGKLYGWSTNDTSTSAGSYLPGGLATGPRAVAVEADGKLVFTEALPGVQNVRRLDPSTGTGTLLSSGGQLDVPRGLAVEPDGSILVVDTSTLALIRIDPVTGAQQSPPVSSGGILASNPYRIAIAPQTQCSDGVDQDGDGLVDLADPDCQNASDDAEWHLAAGDLVMTDSVWLDGSGAILRVDAAGTHVTTLYGGLPLITPFGVGLGRDGEIWFTDVGTNRLLRLDGDDGRLSMESDDPLIENPRSLAVDRSGDVFIGTQTVHGILRVRKSTGQGEIEFVTQNKAIFDYPVDLQLSADGTKLYLVDRTNVQDIVIETDLTNPGQHSVNSRKIVDFAGLASNPQPRGVGLTGAGDLLSVESETAQLYEIGLPVASTVGPGPGLLTGGSVTLPLDVIEEPSGDRILLDAGQGGLHRVQAGMSQASPFFAAPEISGPVLMVRVPAACANGFDDDGDGLIDTADGGCVDGFDDSERLSTACDDGYDDDGDGLVDLADPGCTDALDPSESQAGMICDDGLDNDGDGLVDYPEDPNCLSVTDDTEGTQCSDWKDNDGDGLVGLADPDCTDALDDSEWSLSRGDVVVTDWDAKLIRVDPVSGQQAVIYEGLPLVHPTGVAIAADGAVFIADSGAGALFRLDVDRGEIRSVGSSSSSYLYASRGVTLDPAGNPLVCQEGGWVVHVDLATGTETLLNSNVAIGRCEGVSANAAGDIVVTDPELGALVEMDPIFHLPLPRQPGGPFGYPAGIEHIDLDSVLVSDTQAQELYAVDLAADTRTVLSTGQLFDMPGDVAIGPDGEIYVVDLASGLLRVDGTAPAWDNQVSVTGGDMGTPIGVAVAVPEPGLASGLAAGMLGLAWLARRRNA